MNFTWANQLAKTALKNAQRRIDSVLDITSDETESEEVIGPSHSQFDALPEEDEEAAEGGWEGQTQEELYSVFPTESTSTSTGEKVISNEPVPCSSPPNEWGSDWHQQRIGVVDSEPNPIRDSHHTASYQHSPSSNSPDEGCSGDDHESREVAANGNSSNSEGKCERARELSTLPVHNKERSCEEASSQNNVHHDETLTIASSDIEVLRQGDSWSVMSMASSAFPKGSDAAISGNITIEPHHQMPLEEEELLSNPEAMMAEIAQLRSQIQYQERRICDLQAQNLKAQKKSHDLLALKAARIQQSSTEAKLMKKLSEKEEELAGLLHEGEKLAETNGKLSKELKRLKASLAEQEQLAKKGAQAEIDRDIAKEELRGLNAENNKLRATIKTLEASASRVRATEEILASDLRKRDEKIEKLTADVQRAEAGREAAFEEVKRLEMLVQEASNQAEEHEFMSKGVEEITRGLNAAIEEEKQKNERQTAYIDSLEKRLAELMESQRDTAEMVALANSPLLATISQLETEISTKDAAYETLAAEKEYAVEKLTKEKEEIIYQNKEYSAELARLRTKNEEASRVTVDVTEKLRKMEIENQTLTVKDEKSRRLISELRSSLSAREVEIEKLYARIRAEAEDAERLSNEKQQKIDSLSEHVSELEKEVGFLRERNTDLESRKRSTSRPSLPLVADGRIPDPIPYISPNAAQTELAEIMNKYEQSMRQVSSLQARITDMEENERHLSNLRKEFQALRIRYENLLEAHGEKIERIEELEMDVADVKKLFRDQMELLLGKN